MAPIMVAVPSEGANGSAVRKDAINGWGTTIVVESGGICKPDTNIPLGVWQLTDNLFVI